MQGRPSAILRNTLPTIKDDIISFEKPQLLQLYYIPAKHESVSLINKWDDPILSSHILSQLPSSSSSINLNQGYPDSYLPKLFDIDHGMDTFVEAIQKSENISSDLFNKFDFISFRNNFNKIMATPFKPFDSWKIDIYKTKKSGQIFLQVKRTDEEKSHFEKEHILHYYKTQLEQSKEEEEEGPPTKKRRLNEFESALLQKQQTLYQSYTNQQIEHIISKEQEWIKSMYHGYKFEQVCCSHTEGDKINPNEELCGLFDLKMKQNQTNSFRILMAAELDAIDKNHILTKKSMNNTTTTTTMTTSIVQDLLIELKTNKLILDDRNKVNFEKHKLLKTFIQSYLVGTSKIVFGFKNEQGELKKCQIFDTLQIPQYCTQYWNKRVMLQFTCFVLSFLKQNVEQGKSYTLVFQNGKLELMARDDGKQEDQINTLLESL